MTHHLNFFIKAGGGNLAQKKMSTHDDAFDSICCATEMQKEIEKRIYPKSNDRIYSLSCWLHPHLT